MLCVDNSLYVVRDSTALHGALGKLGGVGWDWGVGALRVTGHMYTCD